MIVFLPRPAFCVFPQYIVNFRARRDLESSGKDEDTSDGEWAEVQLELIRQVNGWEGVQPDCVACVFVSSSSSD